MAATSADPRPDQAVARTPGYLIGALSAFVSRIGDPRLAWSTRRDGLVMVLLGVATVISRIPDRAATLQGWDSVLFALGVEDYDVVAGRPHPPGYPVYIFLGKVANWFVGDVNAALVWVSVAASGLAVAFLYGFMREFGSVRAALAGAVLFSLSPFFVFNGVVALSYSFEAAAGVGVAWLAWRTRRNPSPAAFARLGVAWSVAVGIRQSLFFFVTPLIVLVWLAAPRSRAALLRRGAALAIAGAATSAIWLTPAVVASGGLDKWRAATQLQSTWVVFSESVFTDGWPAFVDHVQRLSYFLQHEAPLVPILAALCLLAVPAYFSLTRTQRAQALGWPSGTPTFLAAWLLPALAFYVFVFNGWQKGPVGYVLMLLPGVYAVAAWIPDAAVRSFELATPSPTLRQGAAWVALPLLLAPAPFIADGTEPYLDQEVRDHDGWLASWSEIRSEFPPNETALLAWYSWAYAKWYFPDYVLWSYLPVQGHGRPDWILTLESRDHVDDVPYYEAHFPETELAEHPIPPNIRRIVLFDFQLAGENEAVPRLVEDVDVKEAYLSNGWRILYFETGTDHPTVESHFRFIPDVYEASS